MWITKEEYDEMKLKISTLERHNKGLRDANDKKKGEIGKLNIMREASIASEQDLRIKATELSKTLARIRIENATYRQILRDLTGKNPTELLEAHRKAVRLLRYDEVPVETTPAAASTPTPPTYKKVSNASSK